MDRNPIESSKTNSCEGVAKSFGRGRRIQQLNSSIYQLNPQPSTSSAVFNVQDAWNNSSTAAPLQTSTHELEPQPSTSSAVLNFRGARESSTAVDLQTLICEVEPQPSMSSEVTAAIFPTFQKKSAMSCTERSQRFYDKQKLLNPNQLSTPLLRSERNRRYYAKKHGLNEVSEPSTSTIVSGPNIVREPTKTVMHRLPEYRRRWELATQRFNNTFVTNEFGHKCDVCDRLWFRKDLKPITEAVARRLLEHFPGENTAAFQLCRNCVRICRKRKLPPMSRSNGFKYPPYPGHLPKLNVIEERLISPRLPYMQVRRLRHAGQYGIVGQVINVPVDVNNMVRTLPRQLDDDYVINVNIKRSILHKSSYLSGFVRKGVIKAWLRYLVDKPLYRQHGIEVDWTLDDEPTHPVPGPSTSTAAETTEALIEPLNVAVVPESDICYAQQHTMVWNESRCLDIAPGQRERPLNIIFDRHAEELSFPKIYLGEARNIKEGVRKTLFTVCTSEIRRSDRRGVTPQHVLYMAMKVLRQRVTDGIYNSFRFSRATDKITRRQIENREFVEELVEMDTAFLKSIPNSVQYWANRKRDVFAMIRQLGKPTAFMTLSASEAKWPHLIRILHRWNPEWHAQFGPDLSDVDIMERMRPYNRHFLVAEDPVTCCIYFYRLVISILTILSSERPYNPFGRYRIVDYFLRIEFQHRGSPHAHILLWLANDPKEPLSEDMPLTLQMLTDLCSVSREDLPNESLFSNQIHAHTFTCYKRGEEVCRFGIPFWPMQETCILVPLAKDDNRRQLLREKVRNAKTKLHTKVYNTIDAFLTDIGISNYTSYLDLIRSSLCRPTVCFKRNMDEIYVNTFNPWVASVLQSNMDLQMVLDPYSCAAYVVDYVNKSNRGMSHFHQQLIQVYERDPQADYTTLMKTLALKFLNSVEMSAQEAAWFLLKQPMSWPSRQVVSIPTMQPHERHRCRKRSKTMNSEGIGPDSTDIWSKNIIQKYEERPEGLDAVTLAQYAAWYDNRRIIHNPDDEDNSDENEDILDRVENEIAGMRQPREPFNPVRRRRICRVIRYRSYDEGTDMRQFKREQVLLHIPFRNEHVEITDRDIFLQTYDDREREIVEARREFEANIDVNEIIAMVAELCAAEEENITVDPAEDNAPAGVHIEQPQQENNDDFHLINHGICAVRNRSTMMTKQAYCEAMRSTNTQQRELVLEVIHRLHLQPDIAGPIQIFFTGPAGSGKTFTMKLLMETYNRYTANRDERPPERNAYIACASTGKAAVMIGGVTVHSAFRLTLSRQARALTSEVLQPYRHVMRDVRVVVLDEVSMCSAHLLASVNERLQQITGNHDVPFGGLDFIATGDLFQLPPVNACAVYKPQRGVLGGAILWQSLDYFPLLKVMRQTNERFSSILTKIGAGLPLEQSESELIESRFRSTEWCNENLPDVVRLFFNNADVVDFNRRAIPNIPTITVDAVAVDTYTGYSTEAECHEARAKNHRMCLADTGNLPYTITLTPGYAYMLTINSDVEDGLVNGAIGILRYIEEIPVQRPVHDERNENIQLLLWFQFDMPEVGQRTRIKWKPHVRTRANVLSEDWVPIDRRSCNYYITKKIRCKRAQFPIVPACALTIHKSQGGTFEQIVYNYNRQHTQALVYVALSRVTSLDGLFITYPGNDKNFHHARGTNSPSVKHTRDEYERLSNHRLTTITTKVSKFLDTAEQCQGWCTVASINVQSLNAHTLDISTDSLITRADFLSLSETWMRQGEPSVPIDGYQIISRYDCPNQRAGGVATYRRENCAYEVVPRPLTPFRYGMCFVKASDDIGDITAAEIIQPDGTRFVLCTVYIHQRQTCTKVSMLFLSYLFKYSNAWEMFGFDGEWETDVPLVITGDFNLSRPDTTRLCDFMKKHFKLELISNLDIPTTLGNTCLDLTFARGVDALCQSYVSYFSHHYPLFNLIRMQQAATNVRAIEPPPFTVDSAQASTSSGCIASTSKPRANQRRSHSISPHYERKRARKE